jgi:hypothetical protein
MPKSSRAADSLRCTMSRLLSHEALDLHPSSVPAELTRLICVYPSQPYLTRLNPALPSAIQTSGLLLPASPVILKLTCMQLHALVCMAYVPNRMHAPHRHHSLETCTRPSLVFIFFTPKTSRRFALNDAPGCGLLAMSSLISVPG